MRKKNTIKYQIDKLYTTPLVRPYFYYEYGFFFISFHLFIPNGRDNAERKIVCPHCECKQTWTTSSARAGRGRALRFVGYVRPTTGHDGVVWRSVSLQTHLCLHVQINDSVSKVDKRKWGRKINRRAILFLLFIVKKPTPGISAQRVHIIFIFFLFFSGGSL